MPCTSVARTLLDLAAVAPRELSRAIGEAEFLKLLDRDEVDELLARSRGRRGVARLRNQLAGLDPRVRRTRSELERRFLALCSRAGLPQPDVNCLLELRGHFFEADFLWGEPHRLIIETDGREAHDTRTAFDRDRRRDQLLMLEGWRVARVTWRQVFYESEALAQIVRGLLNQSTGR